MEIRDRHALKAEADRALQAASYDPRRLVLIHAGISALVLLAITAINFLLDNQIESTGGLSGLETRTILSTVQSVLQTASTIALPFWEIGYTFALLRIVRRETAAPSALLDGFRNFGPVLRFMLIKYVIFIGIAVLCIYPSLFIYMLTPLADPLLSVLEPLASDPAVLSGEMLTLDDAAVNALIQAMWPVFIIFLLLYLLITVPVYYRLRMGELALADEPGAGAFAALRRSFQMTKKNCMALFRLDLSFWWFYGLEVLLTVLCYGDVLLPMLGISLPISNTTAYFLFYILNLAGQVALYWWAKNRVMGTYAVAYDTLKTAPRITKPVQPRQPWNYA